MNKGLKKAICLVQAGVIAASIMAVGSSAMAAGSNGTWVKGDFHTHTYLSDGSYTATEVAAKAKQFGLDWYSATDHGGATTGTRNQNGAAWDAGTANLIGTTLPRWASILSVGETEINNNRNGGMLQFSGFEWNVPTKEHASVGIVGNSNEVKNQLAKFDYIYDGTAEAYNNTFDLFKGIERSIEGKTESGGSKKLTNNTHMGALDGAKYLQDNFSTTSYFLPNHPSRALKYTAADFKEFNDEAPDVFFGAELLPGHQASAWRGGYGQMALYDPISKKTTNIADAAAYAGSTLSAKIDSYVAKQADQTPYTADVKAGMLTTLKSNIAKQRTYGGADYMLAKVGGVWDTMLSEGRKFWVFGNSDFHIDTTKVAQLKAEAEAQGKTYSGEPDFWPGEYSKNYTYTYGKEYQAILDGMRSGNSFTALGDLINALDYKVSNNTTSATMGGTITPVKNKETVVTVRFKSPAQNNNGQTPVVDHIDVIAGEVKGVPAVKYVDSSKTGITSFEDPTQYLTAAYQNDDVTATTKVVKTLNKNEFKVDSEGYFTATFTLPASNKDMYYRLRGTNNAVGTANVDANGSPTIDTAVEALAGTNTVDKAYSDLWFYSNPIFVNKQVDGATIQGTLKDNDGKVLANTTVKLDTDVQTTTTDANGNFVFHNVAMDVHTITAFSSSGAQIAEFTFNLQRGEKTEFALGDVWLQNNLAMLSINFATSGNTMLIKSVSDLSGNVVPVSNTNTDTDNNPTTGDNRNIALIVLLLLGAGMALQFTKGKQEAKEIQL